MEVNMSNNKKAIEDLYEKELELYSNLKTISYEEVVDLLKDGGIHSQVGYFTWLDVINRKNYYCVTVLHQDDEISSTKQYLAEDQNPIDIYNNLIKMIETKKIKPVFKMLDFFETEIFCSLGNNKIIFPREIVQNAYDSSCDEKEDGIRCIYGKKEIYIPKVLNKETKYKKTKEYTM